MRMTKDFFYMIFHFFSVTGHPIIFAATEEFFFILPGRADQGDTAGERFKRPDGRDARQHFHIGTPRYMNGHPVLCKYFRDLVFLLLVPAAGSARSKIPSALFPVHHRPSCRSTPDRLLWESVSVAEKTRSCRLPHARSTHFVSSHFFDKYL